MSRLPASTAEWNAERDRLIGHIRALLLAPTDATARRRALDHLVEVFEDDGLEGVRP